MLEFDGQADVPAGTAQDPAPPERSESAGVRRDEGMEIGGVDVVRADGDEESEHDELDDGDSGIEPRRFADAQDQQGGQRKTD